MGGLKIEGSLCFSLDPITITFYQLQLLVQLLWYGNKGDKLKIFIYLLLQMDFKPISQHSVSDLEW